MKTLFTLVSAVRSPLFIACLATTPLSAWAEFSLNQAINDQLKTVAQPCDNLLGEDIGVLTGGLEVICARRSPAGNLSSAQGPSAGNTHNLAGEAQLLLKNARGETGETQALNSKWSLFANVDQESLDHDTSPLADAFDSSATRVNFGVNYALGATSNLGMAVVSKTHQGDYEEGGDFDTSSLGVRFIADLGLGERAFLQLLVGLDNSDTERNRATSFIDKDESGTTIFSLKATANTDFSYDQTEAALVLGSQYDLGSATIAPLVALNWQNSDFGTHSETGESGLEITTHNDSVESLQAVAGVQTSWAIATEWGVWAPQVGASFINEFETDSRQVEVSFTGDTRAKRFTYDTEEGDSSYLAVSAGSVFIIKNGWQFYLNAETYTGYEHYSRTIFSSGLRVEL